MTDDRVALRALHEKGSDDDTLTERVNSMADRLMQIDAENRCSRRPLRDSSADA